ncbi:MAG: anhydro-N-acetylmuramic acid kinase [Alphaproteobacteria bacterium]
MRVIGLMSGTSMDGVDVAIIDTDGHTVAAAHAFRSYPYSTEDRNAIKAVLGKRRRDADVDRAEKRITQRHVEAIRRTLDDGNLPVGSIDLVGFHGQTITHDPANRFTWQIGDAEKLASETGFAVAFDFRSADVAAGGQGAPLAPVFHRAIAETWDKPLVVLNLGGVANVTWIGRDGAMLAFDTGPANSLIDDWMFKNIGEKMDEDGRHAARGTVDENVLGRLLDNPYFSRTPPKSLDRGDFTIDTMPPMSVEDGAATLTAFTVESIALAGFPEKPKHMLVAGGGGRNPTIMKGLQKRFDWPVTTIDTAGWSADAIEAQAFAFMAVRCRYGLPITFPGTTGVAQEMTGGRIVDPA